MTRPTFSFGDALGAPLVLIRRQPLAVFAWGALMTALAVAMYSLLLPAFLDLPIGAGDGQVVMDAYSQEMLELQAISNGMTLMGYVAMLVGYNAVGRATLAPGRKDRFFFMRLGMDEVRVAMVVVACFVGWYVGVLILALVGVAIGFLAWSMGGETAVIGWAIVYGLALLVAALWAWARILLLAPATLILRRFAFVEGWALARGQVWKLVGLNVVIYLIYFGVYLAVGLAVLAILAAGFFAQGLTWPTDVQTPADLMPLVRSMIVPMLLTLPILALAYGVMMTLWAAPSVRATRLLLDNGPSAGDVRVSDALQPVGSS